MEDAMLFADAAEGRSVSFGLRSNAAFESLVATAANLSGSAGVINQQVISIAAEPICSESTGSDLPAYLSIIIE